MAMEIKTMRLDALRPSGYNPRIDLKPGDPEYDKLKRSVETFGYVEPIIWNKRTERVVGGHQRLKVMLDLGIAEESVVIVDLAEDDEKALNVALNKISGDWDMPRLKDLLESLDTGAYDITLTGFDTAEIEDIMSQYHMPGDNADEDDFDTDAAIEAAEKNPFTRPGDLYILGGKHRLMCGDSTDSESVELLMGGEKADMVFTDPPYGVSIGEKNKLLNKKTKHGGGSIEANIINDTLSKERLYDVLLKAFSNVCNVISDNSSFYVCSPQGGGLGMMMMMMMKNAGLEARHILIWVKNQATFSLGRLDYDYQHEPILFGWKKTHKRIMKGKHKTSCWFIDKPRESKLHPTMKPIALIENALLNSSEENDIVLDPFGGSGSTLIACEQLQRACYTMELDPVYCDVILKRYVDWRREHAHPATVMLVREGEDNPCPFVETIE